MKLSSANKFIEDIFKNPRSIIEIPRWLKYKLHRKKTPIDFEIPWMTFGAIDYLEKYSKLNMSVFEYGSGGSTVFFSKRVHSVTSVEYDEKWYELVKLKTDYLKNVQIKYIPAQNAGKYLNYRDGFHGMYFDNYVKYIDATNSKYDIIVIDGRQRNDCLKHAINRIKENGIIIFDNFDREYYKRSVSLINKKITISIFKGLVPFGNFQSETAIIKLG